MTLRILTASLAISASATAAFAQEAAVDCTLPANAELQQCIDLLTDSQTGLVTAIGPIAAIVGAAILGAGGGGGNGGETPTTPTTSSTN